MKKMIFFSDFSKSFLPLFEKTVILSFLIFIGACKEKPTENVNTTVPKGQGLFVVNEGTFGLGNAGLYYLNLENEDKNSGLELFKANNNRPLGDVFQSMALINGKLWLVVNNSGKVEVLNPDNLKSEAIVKGLQSPRYALQVSPEKVYISDLYANAISIVNTQSMSKTGEIKCKGWTEEMILYEGKVWVTNHESNYLYVVDPASNTLSDSIKLAFGGSGLLSDKEGKIWVLCSGDAIKKQTGGLFSINPKTMKVEKQWLFSQPDFNPIKLRQNPSEDSLFFIYQGVFGFSKNSTSLPANAFIQQGSGSSFYGLTIHAGTGHFYVADAADFVSKGNIRIYSRAGFFIKSHKVGVVPGEFLWW